MVTLVSPRASRLVHQQSNVEGAQSAISDIDRRYLKVVQKIPLNLRIYIPHAIEEFNKQLEEYEVWKAQLTTSGAQHILFSGGPQNVGNQNFTI